MLHHSCVTSTKLRCFLLFVAILTAPLQSAAQVQSQCARDGYAVGFFNGMWNTPDDAYSSLAAIRSLVSQERSDERVEYFLFYNASEGYFQDIVQTFVQRANEIDQSGQFQHRLEYLWEILSGSGWSWDLLVSGVPEALQDVRDLLVHEIFALIAEKMDDQTVELTIEEHTRLLARFAQGDDGTLLIGHSQGNLFANTAYDRSEMLFGDDGIRVVHVAPASPTLRGEYRLANIDVVIEALRAVRGRYVQVWNLELPRSPRDWSGHLLVQTYLDPSRPGRRAIANVVGLAMDSMAVGC